MSASADRERRGVRAYGLAAGFGAVAYLLSYLLVYLATIDDVRNSLLGDLLAAAEVGDWVGVGWLFYNAQFVDLVVSASGWGIEVSRRTNFVGEDEFSTILYAVPPLVLLAAGIAATRAGGLTDARDAAVTGAATVLGYLPLVALGAAVLFEVSRDNSNAAPDLAFAVLLAGLVYPIVFGGLGGVLAAALGRS